MGWNFLIVDDEPIERLAMKKIITDHVLDVASCFEAGNGREAVDLATRHHPDIIFMDIQMPGMDGVEAVRQIRSISPHIRFIMVSAFDTFQYAQQVMREGVKEYLLKPSKKEDIIQTVDRVLAQIKEERQSLSEHKTLEEKYQNALAYIKSDWVTSLLQDQLWLVDSEALIKDSQGEFTAVYAMVVQINHFALEKQKAWYQDLRQLVTSEANGLVGPMTSGQIPILLPSKEENEDASDQHRGIMLARKILHGVKIDWDVRIGIGHAVPSVDDFSLSYHQALTTLTHTSVNVPYLFYSSQHETKSKSINLLEKEKQLINELRAGRFDESFDHYFNECVLDAAGDVDRLSVRLHETRILLEHLLLESGLGIQIPGPFVKGHTLFQIREEAMIHFSTVARQINAWRKETMGGTIDKAKQYIAERYKESLTLDEAAASVQLSPYYFSKLFKEEVGVTFIEWLSSFRIEEAKRLLRETALSLKEICFEVGYNDPNYFSRVFKKMTGMSASDYRREQASVSP